MTAAVAVVVVGSLNRDYVVSVDRLPQPGETLLGDELVLWCGGKGGNQAVAAALIGAPRGVQVSLVGAVGADTDGTALLEGLDRAGVECREVKVRSGARSGAALITVASDAENTIVVAPGANLTVGAAEVLEVLRRRRPTVAVLQCEVPARVVADAVTECARLGVRPVLNLAPVVALDDSVLALCDPLVVNGSEAAELLGHAANDARAAARELAGRARSVVLTAGASGAYVVADGRCTHVPAQQVNAVDTTGAGDAFTGALSVALALEHDLVAAATWGTRVAAHAVARPGAQASFPHWRDVDLDESPRIT